MKRSIAGVCAFVCVLLSSLPVFAQSGVTVIGTSLDTIGTIDTISGDVTSHPITVPGKTVGNTFGVARDPQTGTMYAIVNYTGVSGRHLISIDPATGAGTIIGQTEVVSDIAFGADGTLYAIGGNFSGAAASLFTVNKTTGAPTTVARLSPGAGQTLAFNDDDGLLYHGASTCDIDGCFFYLETFNPQSPVSPPSRVFTLRDTGLESSGLTHIRGPNFLVGGFGPAPLTFVNVKTGTHFYMNGIDAIWSGLTTIPAGGSCPANLYATGPFEGPGLLHTVDPGSGAAALVGPVGFNDLTGIDFATDGVLYALGRRADDSGVQVLLTIDPCTGQGTEVGPTGTLGGAQLREMAAMPNDELYAFLGQDLETIGRVTGGTMGIGSSGITADDFGLEYSPVDDKLYFATVFNAIGTLYSIDPGTGASTVASALTLPPNISALRAMDFNPGNNTMYALIADSAFPGTTSLATVNTTTGAVSIVGTTSRFTTLAFKDGTPSANFLLTVIKEGSGNGTITSAPSGIDCGATCELAFAAGTTVTLTAEADGGSRFDGWSGACSGAGSTCVTSMNAMRTVRAQFTRLHHLQINYGGANNGHIAHVTIHDAGLIHSCAIEQGCDILVGQGEIILHAEPGPGGTFTQWGAPCNGSLTDVNCTFTINSDMSIAADFLGPYQLAVVVQTNDHASVSDGTGSNSTDGSGTYFFYYTPGTSVALLATRGNYSVFKQFSRDCIGQTCNLTMNSDHVVTATFADGFFIHLSNLGTGNGTVDPNVYCNPGSGCNATFEVGTTVTLTAQPNPGSQFAGWGGACSGASTCQITSNSPIDVGVTATFELLPPAQPTLTVNYAGTGSGDIYTEDLAFCPPPHCSFTVPPGTQIGLFAFPHTGSVFSGWSGACIGTQTSCLITMDANKTVTVTFSPPPTLTFGSAPPAVSVNAGQPAGFPINLQVRLPVAGTVVLSCSGLPAASVCTFNPNNIPIAANQTTSTNSQLTITTTARTIGRLEPPWTPHPVWAIGIVAMFGFHRRTRVGAMLVLALLCVLFIPACGGGGSKSTPPKTQFGTPAGTYTVTVNATSGTTNQTTTVTLTVQ